MAQPCQAALIGGLLNKINEKYGSASDLSYRAHVAAACSMNPRYCRASLEHMLETGKAGSVKEIAARLTLEDCEKILELYPGDKYAQDRIQEIQIEIQEDREIARAEEAQADAERDQPTEYDLASSVDRCPPRGYF